METEQVTKNRLIKKITNLSIHHKMPEFQAFLKTKTINELYSLADEIE